MLTELENTAKVVGVKQTRRALSGRPGRRRVFLARDADPALTEPLAAQAAEQGVPVRWTEHHEGPRKGLRHLRGSRSWPRPWPEFIETSRIFFHLFWF